MSKRFRECSLDQDYLLPPSLHDWLPENHLARFIAEVSEQLDLGQVHASYQTGPGGVSSAADGAIAAVWVLRRAAEFAADREGHARRCGLSIPGGESASGSRHHRGVSAAACGGAGKSVCASTGAVPRGGFGKSGGDRH